MKNKEETVKVTVVVELPKKAKDLLEDFAKRVNTTVEGIFLESITATVTNFYNGGFCEIWTNKLKHLAKEIEEQFDC